MKDANKILIRCAEKENGEKNMMKGMKRQRKKILKFSVYLICAQMPLSFPLYMCKSSFLSLSMCVPQSLPMLFHFNSHLYFISPLFRRKKGICEFFSLILKMRIF